MIIHHTYGNSELESTEISRNIPPFDLTADV